MSHETNTNKRGSAVDETDTDRGQDDMPAVPRGWWDLDYRAWAMKDNWTVYEAIEIVTSRVIEPDVESKMREDALADYRYADSYVDDLRMDVVAALEMDDDAPFDFCPKGARPRQNGIIRVKPRSFVQWAVRRGVDVPEGLREALVEVEDDDISVWFDRQARRWQFSFRGEKGSVGNPKGMKYLAELLRRPNQGIPASTLHRVGNDDQTESFQGYQETYDLASKQECLKQVDQLRADIEAAQKGGRPAEARESEQELEQLERYLSGGQGLSGTLRKVNPDLERKRNSVSKAIKRAIDQIERVCPGFSEHLRRSISYGHCLAYSPK